MSIRDKLPLKLPDAYYTAGSPQLIASVSTGKDSTAMVLAMLESGLDFKMVMADTRWELPPVYDYLETLRKATGQIVHVVSKPGGMPGQLAKGRFPARQQRWCTEELKKEPLLAFHEKERENGDTVAVIGIRRDEATTFNSRGRDPEWEFSEPWDGYIWRPILNWSVEDVLNMHNRHDVPVNPLYQLGFDRVGCGPCIFESKEGIRLIAQHFPERIDEIENFEALGTARRKRLNLEAEKAGEKRRYKHEETTFFLTKRNGFSGIREVVNWSKTERGGRVLPLFPPEPRGGCMKWGLCDMPDGDGGRP